MIIKNFSEIKKKEFLLGIDPVVYVFIFIPALFVYLFFPILGMFVFFLGYFLCVFLIAKQPYIFEKLLLRAACQKMKSFL